MTKDVWATGDRYEPYVGRWSRLVARAFLGWLAVPAGKEWLDVGCGTGALCEAILDRESPRSVRGIDPSSGFIEFAKERFTGRPATFEVGDAQSLSLPSASLDAAVSGLVLNFVPDPSRAVAEMARVVRPHGVVAAYVWDYAGRMELMRHFWDAAVALDPAAQPLDEGRRFPLCHPEPLGQLFRHAGLDEVTVCPIDVPTHFRDFEDYWTPFLGGQGPAPGYAMSLEEARRDALRERIRSRLPVARDGSIDLVARAWAVRGHTVPLPAPVFASVGTSGPSGSTRSASSCGSSWSELSTGDAVIGPSRPRALVTGASSGIGAAFAERLAKERYDLILVARRAERLRDLAARLARDHGVQVDPIPADLTHANDLHALERVVAEDAALALLVNNAGFGGYGPFASIDPELAEELIRLQILAVTRLTRAALPGMIARRGGAIINVSSRLAWSGTVDNPMLPRRVVYAATKAYINSFTALLHAELQGTGVQVQALCPGVVRTEFHERMGMDPGRIPASIVMNAEDVVLASLRALELGEVVCVPALEDPALVGTLGEAEREILARSQTGALAQRYRKP